MICGSGTGLYGLRWLVPILAMEQEITEPREKAIPILFLQADGDLLLRPIRKTTFGCLAAILTHPPVSRYSSFIN